MENKKTQISWEKPTIERLGKARDIIKGGAPGQDPKVFGTGDAFVENDLTT
tara:strand:+ start:11850 stop:12002 length:153 start_codon:yes stop_codon:yes gene_type:complete